MKIIMMNMVRIMDGDNVVVLDKKKKYGWEGLTFPGGKFEKFESGIESAIREAKEETNLDISDLHLNGIIQWIDKDTEEIDFGFLYTANSFKGNLEKENREGNLFFCNYEEFKKMDNHSDSMEYILPIYDGKYSEVKLFYKNGKIIDKKIYKNN